MIVFVSGGARSGKSLVAEQCVQQYADGKTCYYVATADIYDSEMAERVGHHQARRANHWVTLEAPLNIEQAVAQLPASHAMHRLPMTTFDYRFDGARFPAVALLDVWVGSVIPHAVSRDTR